MQVLTPELIVIVTANPGGPCLLAAIAIRSPEAVRLLVKYGADLEVEDGEAYISGYNTPLGVAVYWGHAEIAGILLSAGANKNISIDWYHANHDIPIFLTHVKWNRPELKSVLLAHGVNVECIGCDEYDHPENERSNSF